jgi:hypothetical protein
MKCMSLLIGEFCLVVVVPTGFALHLAPKSVNIYIYSCRRVHLEIFLEKMTPHFWDTDGGPKRLGIFQKVLTIHGSGFLQTCGG